MSFYRFHEDDLFINTIETEPQYNFYIYSGTVYINGVSQQDQPQRTNRSVRANNSDNIHGVPNGYISLYDYNIDRLNSERIYPFVYKDGNKNSFKTISKVDYNTKYSLGDVVSSSYNMSASISRTVAATLPASQYPGLQSEANHLNGVTPTSAELTRRRLEALKTTLDHYRYLSPHYEFSGSLGDKGTQALSMIYIPSIFYGSSIKKGSLKLDFYVTGSLIGRLTDSRKNGELVQESGALSTNDGSVAGVVLYNEGIIILTGSWDFNDVPTTYDYDDTAKTPKWKYWGYGANDGNTVNTTSKKSSTFLLEYSAISHTQTLTMFAQAKYGELNHSNNPTFLTASAANKIDILSANTGAYQYIEKPLKIKNIISASYTDQEPPFKKTTYITKVAIYDKFKNLIGVAKLATPVRKTEDVNYTFKIKLDI